MGLRGCCTHGFRRTTQSGSCSDTGIPGVLLEEPHVEQREGRGRNSLSFKTNLFISLDALGLRFCTGFPYVDAWASHRDDFSCCRAPSLGAWTSVGAPWHVESWASDL